jgi:hypothetical protein
MIDSGEIVHVSVEASCRVLEPSSEGQICTGLVLNGLALLTRDVLPGVPLTRIMPIERIFERIITAEVKNLKEGMEEVKEREWDADYINSLPDSAFAVIEPAYQHGETGDKRARHLPHHDRSGEIDLPHLRNALARLSQIRPVTDSINRDELVRQARRHLCSHARRLNIDSAVCGEGAEAEKTPCERAKESLLKRVQQLETEVKMLEETVERQKEAIRKLAGENRDLTDRLKRAKRYSRIIVHI